MIGLNKGILLDEEIIFEFLFRHRKISDSVDDSEYSGDSSEREHRR